MQRAARRIRASARFAAVTLSVVAIALLGAAAPLKATDPSARVAERALALLVRADAKALASMHHYPESYTANEHAKDVSDVAAALELLFGNFGKPEALQPTNESVTFYEIGVFGGTVPYWASVSPYPEQRLIYSTRFANLGPGYVVLSVVRIKGGPPKLRTISFALPFSSPTAKPKIIDLSVDLMKQMGVPVSPEIRKSIAEQLEATTAPPASVE